MGSRWPIRAASKGVEQPSPQHREPDYRQRQPRTDVSSEGDDAGGRRYKPQRRSEITCVLRYLGILALPALSEPVSRPSLLLSPIREVGSPIGLVHDFLGDGPFEFVGVVGRRSHLDLRDGHDALRHVGLYKTPNILVVGHANQQTSS